MAPPPDLRMLWESVDPGGALKERIGFTDASSAVNRLAEVVGENWGTAVRSCAQLVMSGGNLMAWIEADGHQCILKWSVVPETFQRLADAANLISWLHAPGVPVAAPVPARDGRLRMEVGGVSLEVCPVVAGELLDVEVEHQVAHAGHVLALLHEFMAAYPQRVCSGRPDGRRQLVHNDFRSANLLHDGSAITAVLDFDEVTYRTRAADVAKAAVLLATSYRNWAPTAPTVRRRSWTRTASGPLVCSRTARGGPAHRRRPCALRLDRALMGGQRTGRRGQA